MNNNKDINKYLKINISDRRKDSSEVYIAGKIISIEVVDKKHFLSSYTFCDNGDIDISINNDYKNILSDILGYNYEASDVIAEITDDEYLQKLFDIKVFTFEFDNNAVEYVFVDKIDDLFDMIKTKYGEKDEE